MDGTFLLHQPDAERLHWAPTVTRPARRRQRYLLYRCVAYVIFIERTGAGSTAPLSASVSLRGTLRVHLVSLVYIIALRPVGHGISSLSVCRSICRVRSLP